MRVLYVHHGARLGGAPLALRALLNGVLEHGVDPAVYLPPGEVADLYRELGVRVITGPISQFSHGGVTAYFGMRWGVPVVREIPRLVPHLRRLGQALAEVEPDLVHLNEVWLEPAARLVRGRSFPTVRHLRATLHARGPRRRELLRRSVAAADAAIVINDAVAASWGPLPNATQIFDPVDLELFHPGRDTEVRREVAPGFSGFLVATLSQIYPEKGVFDLLDALARLHARRPELDVGIAFVGAAPRVDFGRRLEQEAARAGIADRVFLPGYRRDPARIYRAVDAVVFPAHAEGPGMPVLEGGASGLPVIATSPTRRSAIIEHDVSGILVPPRDPEALGAAIEKLAADPEFAARLGAEAARRAVRFDRRRHAEAIVDVYKRILASRGELSRAASESAIRMPTADASGAGGVS